MKIFLVHLAITAAAGVGVHYYLSPAMGGLAEFGLYLGLFFLLWLSSYLYHRRYFLRFWGAVLLALYFIRELVVTNLEIIYYVITPGLQFRPAVLEYELRLKSPQGIVLLANLITLTPGTLSIHISEDHRHLYFHSINVPDGNLGAAREKIRNGFEKRILRIFP